LEGNLTLFATFHQEEIVPLSKEERKQANKKRKATTSSSSGEPNSKKPRSNTAIYITSLPASTSTSLLHSIFSKAGLILEDTSGSPRIKLYTNEDGSFKGEALVVYLQKESVELAVRLFDQTELRLGSGEGLIGVQEAKWEEKKKESRDGKGGEELGGVEKKKKEERQKKMGKKAAALRQYVVSLSLSHYPRLFKRADLDEVDFVQEIRRLVFRR